MSKRPGSALQPWVAFLRAINVGGHIVKMDRLRAEFESLGFRDVQTFIASGNVLFAAPSGVAASLEQRIERRLEQTLGYPVAAFLRTPEELAALATFEPFPDRDESSGLWMGFLKSALPAEAQQQLASLGTDMDAFHSCGRELFWMCRTKFSESRVSGAKLEKAIGSPATFRNVTTVRRLALKTNGRPEGPAVSRTRGR